MALRYALPHVPFPAPLPNFHLRYDWLIAHAVFSAVAFLAGPWQFLSAFRRGSLLAHREWMIRRYALTAAITLRLYLPVFALAELFAERLLRCGRTRVINFSCQQVLRGAAAKCYRLGTESYAFLKAIVHFCDIWRGFAGAGSRDGCFEGRSQSSGFYTAVHHGRNGPFGRLHRQEHGGAGVLSGGLYRWLNEGDASIPVWYAKVSGVRRAGLRNQHR